MALLRVRTGENRGRVVPLDRDQVVLGRDNEELPVFDHGVSRRHAEVFRAGEMYLVRDLGSRNGTFVNDERVEEWVLRAGDRVQIGSTQLVFEDRFTRPDDSRTIHFRDSVSPPGSTLSIEFPPQPGADEERRRSTVLGRVSRILGTGEELEGTMERVAKTLAVALQAEHVYVFASDESRPDGYRLVAGHDCREVAEVVVSRTILQRVHRDGLPVLSSDALLDGRFSRSESVLLQKTRSLLCVPLMVRNRPVGALYATNTKRSEVFTPEDLELATVVGMIVGNSLELWELVERRGALYRSVLKMLAGLSEQLDADSRGRSERIANSCAAIGRAIGRGEEQVQQLWIAGLLHDIGAIGLAVDDVHSVNRDQRKAKRAAEILGRLPELHDVAPAIVKHTERLDGSGFPEGVTGDAVPVEAQVVGLSVVFDELLRHGAEDGGELTVREALGRIRELAPAKFSTTVVNALLIAYRRNQLFQEDRTLRALGLSAPGLAV